MSLVTDNGNFYLGNCSYQTSVYFPENYYLQGENLNDAFQLFTTLANALGYNLFDFGTSEEDWENSILNFPVFKIAFSGDNNGINGRLEGKINYHNSDATAYTFQGKIYGSNSENIVIQGNSTLTTTGKNNNFTKFIVSASENSFFFLPIPSQVDAPPTQLEYFLFLRLVNINPSGNLYNSDNLYKHLLITGHLFNETENSYYLWKNPLDNGILTSGNAEFEIVCSDAQTPTGNWLTDAVFFHSADSLGNPWIGVADNLVKMIEGDLQCGLTYHQDIDDNRSPYWLALNKITPNKRLLVRVNAEITGLTEYNLIPQDPYLANVVLYLKGDGENNSTNIIDSSPNPKNITRFGNTKISTAQSKYGGSSIYFNGNSDYLTIPASNDWSFGTGDFTIEGWINFSGLSFFSSNFRGQIVSTYQDQYKGHSLQLKGSSANSVNELLLGYGDTVIITGNFTLLNSFAHVAVSRSGNVTRLFVNGIIVATNSNDQTNYLGNFPLYIARLSNTIAMTPIGYIDSLRITKGVARYTANFNPETDTYLAY